MGVKTDSACRNVEILNTSLQCLQKYILGTTCINFHEPMLRKVHHVLYHFFSSGFGGDVELKGTV